VEEGGGRPHHPEEKREPWCLMTPSLFSPRELSAGLIEENAVDF